MFRPNLNEKQINWKLEIGNWKLSQGVHLGRASNSDSDYWCFVNAFDGEFRGS
jgi:hypothetical protein